MAGVAPAGAGAAAPIVCKARARAQEECPEGCDPRRNCPGGDPPHSDFNGEESDIYWKSVHEVLLYTYYCTPPLGSLGAVLGFVSIKQGVMGGF